MMARIRLTGHGWSRKKQARDEFLGMAGFRMSFPGLLRELSSLATWMTMPSKDRFAFHVDAVFIEEVICLHGTAKSIISDRGRVFSSLFLRAIFNVLALNFWCYGPSENIWWNCTTKAENSIIKTKPFKEVHGIATFRWRGYLSPRKGYDHNPASRTCWRCSSIHEHEQKKRVGIFSLKRTL